MLLAGAIIYFFGIGICQQSSISNGETYAIVVGISSYKYIKPLSYADKDAELFVDLLKSGATGTIREENLILLKNDSANAGNFWSAFMRICNKDLKRGDRVYIYFAGHGDAIKGLNEYYLLLSDCQPANDVNNYLLSFGAIDMYRLKNRIGTMTGKGVDVFLILDACRTNELAGGYASQAFNASINQTKVGEIALLATGPGQVSIEDASFGNGHGLFTYNLIDALSGLADKEIKGNNDQQVSLEEVKDWVGKKVREMSGKFNVNQTPVFCCEDKYNTPIGVVDSGFNAAWTQFKQLNVSNFTALGIKAQRANDLVADSALLALFNHFNEARKDHRLWGESSADTYYEKMAARFPRERLTDDARYALASEFINFAQQKINLYIEGKDLLSLAVMKEQVDSVKHPGFLYGEYERMQKALEEKWTIAGRMIRKAGILLSEKNDSTILHQLEPKMKFLLARGYLNWDKENVLNYKQALEYAQEAYRADSTAAYTADCLGLMYAAVANFNIHIWREEKKIVYRKAYLDSALYFFNKAALMAPKWENPYRNIASKLYMPFRGDQAYVYIKKAIAINPQNASTYIQAGEIVRRDKNDSALYYFHKALALVPLSEHPAIYLKMGQRFINFYGQTNPSDSAFYFIRKALAIDPFHAESCSVLAKLFAQLGKSDSVIAYCLKAINRAPDFDEPYYTIWTVFDNNKMPDSVMYYGKKLLHYKPEDGLAVSRVARYYDNKMQFDSAISYYKRLLVLEHHDMEYARERLAYIYMGRDKTDTRPLAYFMETLNETPGAWRSYFNIACYYANRGDADNCLLFLEKSFQRGMRDRNKLNGDIYLNKYLQSEPVKLLLSKYHIE